MNQNNKPHNCTDFKCLNNINGICELKTGEFIIGDCIHYGEVKLDEWVVY